MRKYLGFFRLRFRTGLQYRSAAVAGMMTQFFWGGMSILAYRAFYESDPGAFPMTFQATASYIWLQQAFLILFAAWMADQEIFDKIADGNVAYEMCRPVSIYQMWFARNAAIRLSGALLRCIPVLVLASWLPAPFGIAAPVDSLHFFLFLAGMVLGYLVTVAFFLLVCMLTFFTISPKGLRLLVVSSVEFLAGAVIPLPFFPDGVRTVLELLPFASMQNVPLQIYSGSLGGEAMIRALLLQVFWLVVLVTAGKALGALAERKVVIQGG